MLRPLPAERTSGYFERGIDLSSFRASDTYWWNREVLEMFVRYGVQYFRKEAIWDFDWTEAARRIYGDGAPTICDPRGRFDKFIHSYLRATQPLTQSLSAKILVKILDKLFVLVGW